MLRLRKGIQIQTDSSCFESRKTHIQNWFIRLLVDGWMMALSRAYNRNDSFCKLHRICHSSNWHFPVTVCIQFILENSNPYTTPHLPTLLTAVLVYNFYFRQFCNHISFISYVRAMPFQFLFRFIYIPENHNEYAFGSIEFGSEKSVGSLHYYYLQDTLLWNVNYTKALWENKLVDWLLEFAFLSFIPGQNTRNMILPEEESQEFCHSLRAYLAELM